jgi:WD40 repeat protein
MARPIRYSWLLLAPLFAGPALLLAQEERPPTADEVKGLRAKYQAERDHAIKTGVAKRFQPVLLEKADEMAKKGAAALAAGRLRQATEAFRQARWQLPYQPDKMPQHVARVLGNLRLRHGRPIYAVGFSPDGGRLLTASADYTVKIWDLANGHERITYTGHDEPVRLATFSPDGATVASAGTDQTTIRLWDAATGKDRKTITGPGEYVTALAFSRDGKHVVAAFAGKPEMNRPVNYLVVYDAQTGAEKRSDNDFRGRVSSLAFSADGKLLAGGVEDGQIRLWQYPEMVSNPKLPAYWMRQHDTGAIYAVAFSPDARTLVCAGSDSVKLYPTVQPGATFQINTPRLTLPSTSFTRALVFSADGKALFTGSADGVIRSWDPETGQPIGSFKGHAGEVRSLAFNPAGNQLASASFDYAARLWDFDIVVQARDFTQHTGPVWSAGFSPDGKRLVTAGADKTVRVSDLATGKAELTITGHNAPVTAAMFSPDGSYLASVGGDKTLRLWDARTGNPLRTGEGHTATITALDISADGKRILTGGADRRVRVWDADTCKPVVTIEDNPSLVAAVALSRDGKQIAVGNVDQSVCLYDAATGKLQHRWIAHGVAVSSVAYSPDGQLLATGGSDQLVRVWPLATPGTGAITLSGHTGPVSSVAFRRDSQHLASGAADQLVKLWKLEGSTGKEAQTFRGHKDWVTSVAFSRDGFYLVSAGVDRAAKIWEITSREIPLLAEHTSAVETIALSPDGATIASGSDDRTIKLWDRATGAERLTLHGHQGGVSAVVFTPDGKHLISSGEDKTIRVWDAATGKELDKVGNQNLNFTNLSRGSPYMFVDPAGKRLLAWYPVRGQANLTSLVHCYDLQTGTQLYSFSETNRKVGSLAFCANGQLVATGAADGSVRVWKLGENQAEMLPGGDWMLFDAKTGTADIALTPDGTKLVATSDKGVVKIGSVARREVLKTIDAHPGQRIIACIVSPDGKRFATVGGDNVVKVWDLDAGRELRRWDLAAAGTGMQLFGVAFTPDSRQLVTANANTTLYVLDLP